MASKFVVVLVTGATLAWGGVAQAQQADRGVPAGSGQAGQTGQTGQTGQAGQAGQTGQTGQAGQGGRMHGMAGFPGGGRGVLGTVTETAPDHYTIKTDAGEIYTVFYSVNTRIVKQGQGRRGPGRVSGNPEDVDRPQPIALKPTDIKVGDVITAGGEADTAKKSLGAVFIAQVDPERAKQMREQQANFGKTWLAGRITTIDGTRITIEGMLDHTAHVIEVDENTSFRRRRESITMADIQPGQMLQAEGGVKGGTFLATVVNAQQPREGGREGGNGIPPN